MKSTPLALRIFGGMLLTVLILVSCLSPMLTRGECVSLIALGNLGKPYVFGKEGPDSYDCSGLTRDAYLPFDIDLIHSAQYVAYDKGFQTIEDISRLVPGDLIFFDTIADRDRSDHVGIWLGMNRFVHASSSEMVVMISEFDDKWQKVYSWSKRILDPMSLKIAFELLQLPWEA